MRLSLFAALPLLAQAASIPYQPGVGLEQNKGQFSSGILFAARPSAYMTATSLVFPPVTLSWDGGNAAPLVTPTNALPYTVNVFAGADPAKWITGIRRYTGVRMANVWPGIDLVYACQPFLSFTFVLSPGASASAIRLAYTGADVTPMWEPAMGGDGLIIYLPTGRIGQNTTAWQDTPAGRKAVQVHYRQIDAAHYGMTLDAYDATQPVTIESTLPLGASGMGTPAFQARSGAFFAFQTENSLASLDAGACGASAPIPPSCLDAVVAKWSPAGDPVWLTYLSGAGTDSPAAMDVDALGNVHLGGTTNSPDFPVTANAAQRRYAGAAPTNPEPYASWVQGDAFLARLDGAGGALLYATYLGGPGDDSAVTVHADAKGNSYIGGPADSGMPVTAGAFSSKPSACSSLAYTPTGVPACSIQYLAKIDTAGQLAYLTYLPAAPNTLTVDAQGGVYIGGSAAGDLPVTPGAYQPQPVHGRDPFIAKLKSDGSGFLYATYYPAPAAYPIYSAFVRSIAVDSKGDAWFNGPCCVGSTIGEPDLLMHEYLAKLKPDGTGVLYATLFIGGELAVDATDRVSVFTRFDAPQVIRTPGGVVTSVANSPMITKLDTDGTVLLNQTVAQSNASYIGFLTQDGNLGYLGNGTIVVVPIAPGPVPDITCVLNAASLSSANTIAPGEIVTIPGRGLGPVGGASFQLDAQGHVPTMTGGTRVLFDGAPAPVLYADDGQVNAIAPFGLTAGTTINVTLESLGRATPPVPVTVVATQPALFTVNSSGNGQVLAFNQDGTQNTPENPAQLGSVVTLFATGTGMTFPASVAGAVAASIDATPVTQIPVVMPIESAQPAASYYGPSPGSLTSITQINLQLPPTISSLYPLSALPLYFGTTAPPAQQPTISLKP